MRDDELDPGMVRFFDDVGNGIGRFPGVIPYRDIATVLKGPGDLVQPFGDGIRWGDRRDSGRWCAGGCGNHCKAHKKNTHYFPFVVCERSLL